MRRLRLVLDRRIAALLFSLTAAALLVTAGVAAPAALPRAEPDAEAARELVALMRAGEAQRWIATYDFTRTLADGRALAETMREARDDDLHVLIAGTSLTIERPNRSYDCTVVEGRAGCHESDSTRQLPESEVLRVAVNAGLYGVSRLPDRQVAGERARCFRILPTGAGVLPDIGTETVVCVGADGIVLDERIVRTTGNTDQRVATAVERDVSTERIRALVRSLGPSAVETPR